MVDFWRSLTIERLAVWILFILLFAMAIRVPVDADTWWHLRSGEEMLDSGELLDEDIYSHSVPNREWINHSWASQIVMALFFRATGGQSGDISTGALGLMIFTALLGTIGMVFVYRMCVGNIYSKAFVMVIGAATAAVFWSPRPQMFSFMLGAITLYILFLYKRHEKDYLGLLPGVMIIWVNLHGGFAIGFIILLGFIVGEVVGNILDAQEPSRVEWRRLAKVIVIFVISLLALSLNPYGPRMILYPFETAGLQTLNLFIQEWQSPNFKLPQTWPFIILLLSVLGFGALVKRRIDWADLSLVTGTALLALWAGRNIALFAIVATPVLARMVDAFLQERGWIIHPMRKVRGARLVINWVLLSVVLLGALLKVAADSLPENIDDIQAELLPIDAIAYLDENPPAGNLLNTYNWGGILIFMQPDIPVFVDGRTDLYGDDFLGDYFGAYLGRSDWAEVIAEYDIQTIFLEDESALGTLLREDEAWSVVYEDDLAVILERE